MPATLFVTLFAAVWVARAADPSVTLPGGDMVIGRNTGVSREFLGIPFATAGRFEPPVVQSRLPANPFKAQQFGPCCPQAKAVYAPNQAEDCLNLNVFAPQATAARPHAGWPVLVFIHGGGGTTGCSAQSLPPLYNGTNLLHRSTVTADRAAVVVTVNYRLSILANLFLDGMRDNLQSRDWVASLTWVHDNIAAFGGDPNSVLVFGESAGGNAVLTLPLLPGADGLFQYVIAESSTAFIATGFANESLAAAQGAAVVADLGCMRDSTNAMLQCLRALDAATIQSSAGLHQLSTVVGGQMLPHYPQHLYRSNQLTNQALAGITIGRNMPDNFPLCAEVPTASAAVAVGYVKKNIPLWTLASDAQVQSVLDAYDLASCTSSPGPLSCCNVTTRLMQDAVFTCPAHRLLSAADDYRPGKQSWFFLDCNPTCPRSSSPGVCQHTSELQYVFATLSNYESQSTDVNCTWEAGGSAFADRLVQDWTYMASHGARPPSWMPFDGAASQQSVMLLSEDAGSQPIPWSTEQNNCDLWQTIDDDVLTHTRILP